MKKAPKTALCAKETKKNRKPFGFRLFLVEVTGFEPATFWSRNPNERFAMSYHDRCCYKKESLSFAIIGHGWKHSVAIRLQPLLKSVCTFCKTFNTSCKTHMWLEEQLPSMLCGLMVCQGSSGFAFSLIWWRFWCKNLCSFSDFSTMMNSHTRLPPFR